ncbi:MAG: hypothetical protein Kow00108_00940 [Calditrichia bacterium]
MIMGKKYILFIIFLFSIIHSESWFEQIDSLSREQEYATIHRILWKINHLTIANDSTVGFMVLNAFEHHIYQQNYEIFYIANFPENYGPDILLEELENDTNVAIFRKPLPWIERALEINPKSGIAFFLKGYYQQQIYIPDFYQNEFVPSNIKKIEKQIAIDYEKAFLYGFRHRILFKYLGDYYYRNRIFHRAKRFYRWNVRKDYFDAEAVLQLALINLNENQPQNALSYAFIAMPEIEEKEVSLKYLALRIVSKANRQLGRYDKFHYYNALCRQLIPDQSEAYIDLIEFYEQKGDTDSVLVWIQELFNNNPFDTQIYDLLPYYGKKFSIELKLIQMLLELEYKYREYDIIQAYAHWKKGDLYFLSGNTKLAKEAWNNSKKFFLKFSGPKSQILRRIGDTRRIKM